MSKIISAILVLVLSATFLAGCTATVTPTPIQVNQTPDYTTEGLFNAILPFCVCGQ